MTTSPKPRESLVYLVHAAALLWPGVKVPVFEVHQIVPQPLDGWSDEDATLLIEEGRRQVDQQVADLDRIRTRSQFAFTTALALLALLLAVAKAPGLDGICSFIAWFLAAVLTLLSLLGSASSMTTRSDLGRIDAASLTRCTPPVKHQVAEAYGRTVRVGADTVATRLTLYRDSVFCLVVGAILLAATWLIITF